MIFIFNLVLKYYFSLIIEQADFKYRSIVFKKNTMPEIFVASESKQYFIRV